ncbi:hypothetical protein Tco_1388814 [Tanacetum coccineum]
MNGTVDYVGETNLASSSVSKENDVTRAEVVNIEENVLESKVENVDKDDSIGEGVNQVMDENNVNETKVEVDKNNNCQEEIDVEEDSDRKGKGDGVCDQSQKSYVDAIGKGVIIFDKTLLNIPTEFDSNGNEIVVFDEVMIAEGSKRWEKTLYAYFVGYSMYVNELKYNLRKMWSRYGFKDIVDYNNGIYFMKFNTDKDKKEPVTIPLRVKICSVPLEAWTTKGISALASRSGKPLVMDVVTASMCKMGISSNGKNDNEGFTQVQNKKSNVVYEKVLKPNYKAKSNLNGKNASRFAFQPKRPVNNNVVPKEGVDKPKEDVVMPETKSRQDNQESASQTPAKKA